MKRSALVTVIGVVTLMAGNADAISILSKIDLDGIEARGGYFYQDKSSLVSGGVFWSPELELLNVGGHSLAVSTWTGMLVLLDQSYMPAASPMLEAGARYITPESWGWLGRVSATAMTGWGFSFVIDRRLYEFGGILRKHLRRAPLAITEIGFQFSYLVSDVNTLYGGLSILWRW
ncbi:MAG: hypothetical protein A2583_06985 [Bdellovibrionales bacterium RIFOXYD1_FULL_53_11]|nr:MAG: hypothetical protein A2583_06985 [Bdellovibrionales bacterium RIFOXYD1_FULL_53_11]